MSTTPPIVVLGAGHAGVQLVASLRQDGYDGGIVLVGGEAALPYQRPSLSKAFLASTEADLLPLRAARFYTDQDVDLRLGVTATAIDRATRTVTLDDGSTVAYGHLVLATGAHARRIPLAPPQTSGVHYLRELADAEDLRAELHAAHEVVVVGGGFLGLEAASVATGLGCHVHVVEAADGLMSRAVSPEISAAFTRAHTAAGVDLLLGQGVRTIECVDGAATAVITSDGRRIPADLVLISVGAVPDTELAAAAGLAVDDGVLVDEFLATSDPDVSAIGDCARWVRGGLSLRRESVQNATDQARTLAARLVGRPEPYSAVPWFWSEQTVGKLQIAGIREEGDRAVIRGDRESGKFSVFHFAGDRLTCVESISKAGDHLAGRRLLESGRSLSAEEAADASVDLRALVADRVAAPA